MRGFPAKKRLKRGLVLAFAVTTGLGLAACSDISSGIDDLFGDNTTADAGPPPDAGAPPPTASAAPSAAAPVASNAGGIAPMVTITPVAIEAGGDTGTAVNKTIQGMRAQVSGLETKLAANAQRLADLRNNGASSAGSYQEAKARITTRLQVGTTKGNPELVSLWNNAQTSLDALTGSINALNALGTDMLQPNSSFRSISRSTRSAPPSIVSGAVGMKIIGQLSCCRDETSQTLVDGDRDRLLSEISDDVQRQTAYVANERGNLTTLASAIKNGELAMAARPASPRLRPSRARSH